MVLLVVTPRRPALTFASVCTSAAPGSSSATGRPAARPSRSSLTSSQGATFTPWMCPTGRFPRPLCTTAPPPISHPPPNKRNTLNACTREWTNPAAEQEVRVRLVLFCVLLRCFVLRLFFSPPLLKFGKSSRQTLDEFRAPRGAARVK